LKIIEDEGDASIEDDCNLGYMFLKVKFDILDKVKMLEDGATQVKIHVEN
jgi:hypothetical protein